MTRPKLPGDSVFDRIMRLLKKSGSEFRIHSHPEVRTMGEAYEKVPHLTHNLVKTIVFRVKNGHWVLAVVHADDRVDYKKLADALGVKRTALRSISPESVTVELGFQVGGVGPFPVREDIRVVVDAKLKGIGAIFCGSGRNTRTVEIDMDDLLELAGAVAVSIAKTE